MRPIGLTRHWEMVWIIGMSPSLGLMSHWIEGPHQLIDCWFIILAFFLEWTNVGLVDANLVVGMDLSLFWLVSAFFPFFLRGVIYSLTLWFPLSCTHVYMLLMGKFGPHLLKFLRYISRMKFSLYVMELLGHWKI